MLGYNTSMEPFKMPPESETEQVPKGVWESDRPDPKPEKSTGQEYSNAYIRQRAYEIWQEREASGAPGDAVSDWLQAETRIVSGADR
jgi:hypothetical protein